MLEINNLAYAYSKDKYIFKDLSFSLQAGSCVVLTGKSGSGKSTLCHILNKEIYDYLGNISLDNICLRQYSEKHFFPEFHFMKQNPQHNFIGLTPEKDFDLWYETQEKTRFLEALNKYSLFSKKNELLWNLSFGELKALYFIYLELFQRKYWILDEPMEALDINKKHIFLELCKHSLNSGTAILLSSHKVHDFEQLKPIVINLEDYQ